MKTLIGGAIAVLFGVVGLAVWFNAFIQIITGCIPVMLLVGGGFALYLGFDELKDSWQNDEGIEEASVEEASVEETVDASAD